LGVDSAKNPSACARSAKAIGVAEQQICVNPINVGGEFRRQG
jgi:hypothetical protein